MTQATLEPADVRALTRSLASQTIFEIRTGIWPQPTLGHKGERRMATMQKRGLVSFRPVCPANGGWLGEWDLTPLGRALRDAIRGHA